MTRDATRYSAYEAVEAPAVGDAFQLVLAGVLEAEAGAGDQTLDRVGTSTSDGPASDAILAPTFTAMPPTFAAIVSTSPVWTPARTSIPRSGTASQIACAHRTPRAGPSNVAKNPSPAVSTSVPRKRPSIARTMP